ncbi:MAG: hypothetical protein KGI60_01895 [Patescibacteria group bacterium]|nr:hypothetical protein [Patescibacteria group bacterium]
MLVLPETMKDKYLIAAFLGAAVLWIFAFSLVYVNVTDIHSVLIIHFDNFRGADFFGSATDVVDILVIGAVVGAINGLLAHVLYYRERFLSYLLAGGTVLYMVLILLAIHAIISVI